MNYILLKGELRVRVGYDSKKDIVSIYFDEDVKGDGTSAPDTKQDNVTLESNVYDSEKAANLILDTVDIVVNGSVSGFRVLNASKYYDKELLSVADSENLLGSDVVNRPSEKVIATISKEGICV